VAVDLAGGDVTGRDTSGDKPTGGGERRTGGRARRVSTAILVVLFALLVPITATTAWVHRTVLDTDTYVSNVAPLASDPRVIAAASRSITDQLYTTLNVPAKVAEVLPDRAELLSVPIANGARTYVQQAVTRVLSSDQFQQLWEASNRFAHSQLVSVLHGDTTVLRATGGQIVLNLVPLLNAAVQNMASFVASVVGHPVSLPPLNGTEVPAATCAKLSAALDRQLPTTCGVITLFRAKNLEAAQRAVRIFDRGTLALLIVTPLVGIAAVALSTRRRRTLLQLTLGAAALLIVVRRTVYWTHDELIAVGRPENKGARQAIVDEILDGYFELTLWLLIAALVIALVALVTGPYGWAVRSRTVVRQTAGAVRVAVAGTSEDGSRDDAVAWARAHFNALRFGAIAVVVLVIAAFDVNFLGFLIIGGVLALFLVGLQRLRPPAEIQLPVAPAPRRGDSNPQT
jgi:hypothetical protein